MNEMKTLVGKFSSQLGEALAIGRNAKLQKAKNEIRNVLITGLGGSGIGGTIASEIVAPECKVPITVNKDYFLPGFVNESSLVIVCSYSGNTEETLQAFNSAIEKKAHIVCITSGGKVQSLSKEKNIDCIIIPGGMPPRACLGYSLPQIFFILSHFELTGNSFQKQFEASIAFLDQEEKNILSDAEKISELLQGKIPVIYAIDGYNGVAIRFRQQLNENSKMLAWHNILPEMNHNELVGWAFDQRDLAVIILRNENDYSRTKARIEISVEVFKKQTKHVIEVWSKGNSHLERALYFIHLTDHVSVFLAEKNNIDAMEIDIINHLKGELSKI